jgi:tRNA A-37 threonylcarbamoyl transferase component Bud32
MASDYLHDNCVSKHEDAKYTLLFVGLKLKAIMKTRKKMIWKQPKIQTKVVKENKLVEAGFMVTFISQ